jgi:hypothetical protein
MDNAIAVAERYDMTQDAMTPDTMVRQISLIQHVMEKVMKDGEHYGVIPGCGKKPSLLKAGAEKLSLTFRLAPTYTITQTDGINGHREYYVKCSLTHIPTGKIFGEGVGACSTMEGKYRFRTGEVEFTDKEVPKAYWTDRDQKLIGGKGFSTKKNDSGKWMIVRAGEKVEHDNPADYYNTVLKMAKKRAHVDAVLTATAASDIFTQDVEDMPEVVSVKKEAPAKAPAHVEAEYVPDVPDFVPPTTPDRYPDPITLEQQTTLNGIIIDKGVDQEKFLKFMGVSALSEIKAKDYKKAIDSLKIAKGTKAA